MADVTVGFGLRLEPRVAQLHAHRAPAAGAQAVEHDAGIHLGEVMIGHFGRIGRMRRKQGLKAQTGAAGSLGVALEAEVLIQYPKQVGGKTTPAEQGLPGGRGFFEGRSLKAVFGFHSPY